jgi:hypothetical protein
MRVPLLDRIGGTSMGGLVVLEIFLCLIELGFARLHHSVSIPAVKDPTLHTRFAGRQRKTALMLNTLVEG